MHSTELLINTFNDLFSERLNTILVKGDDEPIYLPADHEHPQHRVIFAHGFFASAMHELAHWCVAGPQRRLQVDYGYWYVPDGRDAEKQAEFEVVEIRPQAFEWILCESCGFQFQVSCDNLNGVDTDRFAFSAKVHNEVLQILSNGMPERLQQLSDRLREVYQIAPLQLAQFHCPTLE
uniref:elongation factor P hydroxylase n=1 Tax=Thaumasiovibrio occultus TaxID=1891184 RepID=UPI000B35AEC1|nr:elongation factor P hydroxylase [Thaumasiovibrio occultus]